MLWTSTFLNVSIYQFFNFRLGSEFIFHWNCYSFKEKATGNKKKKKKFLENAIYRNFISIEAGATKFSWNPFDNKGHNTCHYNQVDIIAGNPVIATSGRSDIYFVFVHTLNLFDPSLTAIAYLFAHNPILILFHICSHIYFYSEFIWFHVYPIVIYHYHVY